MIFKDMDRIVFAGDSVTDMGSVQPVGEALFDNLGFGYVRILENFLTAWYPETRVRITNAGISGNTSRELLARFDDHVMALNPDWVSICIGINDLWRQLDCPAHPDLWILPDEYEKNVRAMIEKTKGKVKGVFLLSPYVIGAYGDAFRVLADEYRAICRKLAEEYGCIWVDFQEAFDRFCEIRHQTFLSHDRIHPNQMASTLMAREFLKHCDFSFDR